MALTQDDAVAAWERVREDLVGSGFPALALEGLDRLAGEDPEEAVRRYRATRLAQLEASADTNSPWSLAIAHAELDHREAALLWLEKAYEQRSRQLPFLAIAPPLDSLRSDPRFWNLLEALDLPSDLVLVPTAVVDRSQAG